MTQPGFDFAEPVRPRTLPAVAVERVRRASNKARVLARLRQGPATTMDLIAVGGARAVGRCWELRRDGHVIRVEEPRAGLFIYTLVSR